MPRAKDAKVWNEDLVLALRAREEECRQRCSVRQYLWRDGAKAVEAVRRDIYQYNTSGKIVGLPQDLNKTVDEECRAIIGGSKPTVPRGYQPRTVNEQKKWEASRSTNALIIDERNPYDDDPYLRRIKMRGGSYAILMAFHFSKAVTMTKTQLCAAAQDYCDEEMEPNFGAGRSYGAWSSKKTLIRHGLVKECRTTQMGRHGHRCNGVFEYSLTPNGRKFLEAVLRKFPLTDSNRKDEAFSLSKSVRECSISSNAVPVCVPECDPARDLSGNDRIRPRKSHQMKATPEVVSLLSDSDSDSDDEDLWLGKENIIKSRPKQTLPMNTGRQSRQCSTDSDSDGELSFSHVFKKTTTLKSDQSFGFESIDGEVNVLDSPIFVRSQHCVNPRGGLSRSPLCRPLAVCPLKDDLEVQGHLTILIDNRERNRNATPRHMRMELNRHLRDDSGLLRKVWPEMPLATVEEDQLDYGDFVFLLGKLGSLERLPLSIERKRIGDLVQRSYRADHWKQLSRMRECCDHAILLVEGNITKTSLFSSNDNDDPDQAWTPDQHSIDDENSFYRFLGRAILSSANFKVLQTRDEQASYRAIGAVGAVVTQIQWERSAPRTVSSAKVQVNRLYDKLKSRGVPWQIARRVSEEIVSVDHLDKLYRHCQISARPSALVPVIAHSCSSLIQTETSRRLIEYGSIDGWSAAIYSAWNSKTTNPAEIVSTYDEYKIFANDRAKLLSALHSAKGKERAIQESNMEDPNTSRPHRKVLVEGNKHLTKMFPIPKTESFYEVAITDENPLGLILPTIMMHTVNCSFQSDRLVMSVLDGSDFLQRIKDAGKGVQINKSLLIAEAVAKQIYTACDSFLLRKKHDKSVLIIHGLTQALDTAAKQHDYQAHFKILADLCISELMLRHGIVVVHAFRLTKDLEMILREFALACFHYQILTRKRR